MNDSMNDSMDDGTHESVIVRSFFGDQLTVGTGRVRWLEVRWWGNEVESSLISLG